MAARRDDPSLLDRGRRLLLEVALRSAIRDALVSAAYRRGAKAASANWQTAALWLAERERLEPWAPETDFTDPLADPADPWGCGGRLLGA
jgi:hypothetical protein